MLPINVDLMIRDGAAFDNPFCRTAEIHVARPIMPVANLRLPAKIWPREEAWNY
jgi:hypothetical protein